MDRKGFARPRFQSGLKRSRLPKSLPNMPTRSSRLPCAIEGATPVPNTRPPATRPRRVSVRCDDLFKVWPPSLYPECCELRFRVGTSLFNEDNTGRVEAREQDVDDAATRMDARR
jgi:hypothetical protein